MVVIPKKYYAEEEMTWEDWVNSKYNVDGYILHISSFGDIYDSIGMLVVRYNEEVSSSQKISDLIEPNHSYSLDLC